MIVLFIFSNKVLRNEKLNSLEQDVFKKINSKPVVGGYDERYNSSCEEQIKNDKELLTKIHKHIVKHELLKYLESQNISLPDKIKKIEQVSHLDILKKDLLPNITAGRLFKDWLFEF